jgi:hypothetical protein
MSTAMNDNDGSTDSSSPQQKTSLKKRRFTVLEKLCMIRRVKKKIDVDKVSMTAACRDVNIHHKQYIEWTKQINALNETKKRNSDARSLCIGRESILKPIEGDLIRYIFELREQGIGVTTPMVRLKALSLSSIFSEKSSSAQYHAVYRFIKSLDLIYRLSTTESQRDPREESE